jgi:hypothetical protein
MDNSENGRVIPQWEDRLARQQRQGEHISNTADWPLTTNSLAVNLGLARQDEHANSTSPEEVIRAEEHTAQQRLYPRASRNSYILPDSPSSSINFSRSSLQIHGPPTLRVPDEKPQGERTLYPLHKNASTSTRLTAEGLHPPTPSEMESGHSTDSDDAYYCEVGEEDEDMGASTRFASREEYLLPPKHVQTEVVRRGVGDRRLRLQDQQLISRTAQESSSRSRSNDQVADESRANCEKKEGSKFARFLKRTPKGRRFGFRKPRKDNNNMEEAANA